MVYSVFVITTIAVNSVTKKKLLDIKHRLEQSNQIIFSFDMVVNTLIENYKKK